MGGERMGKALDALKELQIVNERIHASHRVSVEPKYLNKLIKELSHFVNNIKNLPAQQTVEILFKKMKKIYVHKEGKLTSRERRNLPFVLPYTTTIAGMMDFVLENIDFRRFSAFKRSLYVYFETYSDTLLTIKLREALLSAVRDDYKKSKIPYLYNDAELLQAMGPKKMAMQFNASLNQYFDKILFPVSLRHSRFVQKAIVYYFQELSIDLASKMKILESLYKDASDKILIPQIAESLIFSVHHSGNQVYRENLLNILHHEMGDPRYSNRQVAWTCVSKEAKNIFISWLKRGDLELFFAIIDRTMRSDLNYQVDAKQMWHARKIFWEKYLDKMYYTKVVLAPEAARIARREYWNKVLDYGKLDSTNINQSLFVFSIGEYVFVEPSYNGTLRILNLKSSPIRLNGDLKKSSTINYSNDIVHNNNEIQSFIHSGNWQRRIAEWIDTYCR